MENKILQLLWIAQAAPALDFGPAGSLQVETAASLDRARDALARRAFDAAVFDLDAPGCGGLSGLEQLCQAFPALAVIALAEADDPRLVQAAFQAGAEDCLAMSNPPAFLQVVQHAVYRHAVRAAASPSISASRTFIAAAPFGVYVLDRAGRYLDANPVGLQLLGYALDELRGLHMADTTALEDRAALETAYQALLRGEPVEVDLRQRTKAGAVVWVNLRAQEMAPDRVAVFCVDITAQKAVARALAENERLLRHGTVLAGLGIWEWNQASGKMVWNDSMFRIYGLEPHLFSGSGEEMLGCMHPEDAARRGEQIEALLREAKAGKNAAAAQHEFTAPALQVRIFRPDGALRHLVIETAAYWDELGLLHLRGVVADNTERVEAEEQLRREQAKYQDVVRTSADGFWIVDSQGFLVEVNDAYIQRSGYSRAELVGMHITQLDAQMSAEEVAETMRRLQTAGRVLFETRHRAKNGTVWPVEISTSYWPEGGGRFVAFLRDLQQRKSTETILRARLRIAEIAEGGTIDDMLQYTLDTAEILTGSSIGFFHFVEPDQETLWLQTWSTNTLANMCTAAGKGSHYPVSQAGVWVDCMKTRAPVIHNDYASLPDRKGMPEGHAPVIRELVVPVLHAERVVAILGVGNKTEAYAAADVETVQDLARFVFDLVERKRAEDALRESERRYRLLADHMVDVVWLLDAAAQRFTYISPSITRQRGYSVEEALQLSFLDTIAPEGLRILTKDFSERMRAFAAGEAWAVTQTHEVPMVCKDGSSLWTEVVTTLIRDDQGGLQVLGVSRDISERRRAQEQLREYLDRLRIAQQSSHSGFWDWDMLSGQLYWSEEFYELFELPPSTPASFEAWRAVLHPDDSQRASAAIETAVAQHIPLYNEFRIQLPDGTLKDIQSVGRTTYAADGRPLRMTGICIDVSERKQIERALQASEERYRGMVEAAFDWIWEVDAGGRYTYASPRVRDILGYEPEEVIGCSPFDFMPEGEAARVRAIFGEFAARQIPFAQLENTNQHKNGQMVVLETNGMPAFDARGNFTGYRGMDRDITARKQAETRLRESEEKFRLAFDTNSDALSITEMKTGNIVLVNQGFLAHTGYTREEVLNHTALDLNLIQTPDERFRMLQGLQEKGEVHGHEFQYLQKNGELRYSEADLYTFKLNGEPHLLSIMRDVTERRQAAEALRQRGEELAQLLEISRVMSSTLELKQIYASLFQFLRRSITCDSLVVAAFDVWEQVIRCEYACDSAGEIDVSAVPLLPLDAGDPGWVVGLEGGAGGGEQSRLSQVIREGAALLLADYQPASGLRSHEQHAYPEFRRTTDLPEDTGGQAAGQAYSAILVPITRDGKVNGVLQVFTHRKNAFTSDHLRFVETLSHMLSSAVANAGLYQRVQTELAERSRIQGELRLQIDRMGALALTSQQLAAVTSDFDVITNTVVRRVVDLFGDGCIFRLANEDGAEMQTVGLYHPDPAVFASLKSLQIDNLIPGGQNIFGRTLDPIQPIIIMDLNPAQVAEPLRGQAQAWVKTYGVTHLATVHIWLRGSVFGSLSLVRIAPSKPFTGDEIAFLQDIADRAGLAVANARLMVQIRRANAALEQRVLERTAELSQSNAELARASRAKDEFLASMSHELRTPLSAVLTLSESIEEGTYGPVNDRIKKPLRIVIESGQHLLTLINDILDLTKIGSGKLDLDLQMIDIEEICAASFRLVRQQAELKHLTMHFPTNLAVKTMTADGRLFKQMLVNLLSNAVKFTPSGGQVGLEVEVVNPGAISFTVWDTGIGIAPENIEKLFKPFVQIDSGLNRQYGGTGLGLSLVYKMAELHGGGVRLTSEPGKGSRFTITLPQPAAGADTPGSRLAGSSASPIQRVWIMEGSEGASLMYAELFHECGLYPVFVSAGQFGEPGQARDLLPDLILRDLTGAENPTAAALNHPGLAGIPIILVGGPLNAGLADAPAVVDCLSKPVNRRDFYRAIEKAESIIREKQPLANAGLPDAPAVPRTVLIAEDNITNQTTYADFLESLGYQVVLAGNGREAVEQARANRPDVILMDIQMPDMDGIEATQVIRADPSLAHTPVVALTALAMPGDRERCFAAGVNDYIAKPASLRHLAEVIAELLNKPHG
jgi:PAS domain S-box-containing protein